MITRISSRIPLHCIMINQIYELSEDGLKSSPETLGYVENTWISRKNKNKIVISYTLLIIIRIKNLRIVKAKKIVKNCKSYTL